MKSHSPIFNQGTSKVGKYVVSSRGDTSIVSARVFDKPANKVRLRELKMCFNRQPPHRMDFYTQV